MPDPTGTRPDRNLAMELVRVTEYGALAAARWVGMGEKESADQAAVDAMRLMLDTVQMDGVAVIGEGEKDEAPTLYDGEHIGDGSPPQLDVGRASGRAGELAGRPLVGNRRHAGGRDLSGVHQMHGRPDARSPVAARRRGAPGGGRRRLRPRRGTRREPPGLGRRRFLRGNRR